MGFQCPVKGGRPPLNKVAACERWTERLVEREFALTRGLDQRRRRERGREDRVCMAADLVRERHNARG